jgi:hypothetical protein
MRTSLVVALLCAACKSAPNESARPPDASVTARPIVSAKPAPKPSASVAPAPTCMPEIDGWVHYAELDARCDFAMPPSAAALPPPIEWERCTGDLAGLKRCRQMRVIGFDGFDRSVAGQNRGRVQLLFERVCHKPRRRVLVAAEADGAVLAAMASRANIETTGCHARPVFIGGGRYLYQLVGELTDASANPEALDLGGSLRDAPVLMHRLTGGQQHEQIAASSRSWGTLDGGVNMGPLGKHTESVHAGAVSSNLAIFGDTALFVDDETATLMAWTKARGVFPLHKLEAPNERVTGIAFNDDLVVWSAYPPRTKPGGECTLVAAKLSLQPPRIIPKRVTTFSCPRDKDRPWALGSGYAAHATNDPSILLVRVADGTTWTIKTAGAPLFVSESELLFELTHGGIARMPIAAIRAADAAVP